MDNIDYKILRCLKDNARLTASAISEEINLSVSAVIERIRKMESSGVIKGYTIEVDQKKLGNEMVAIMEVRLKHPKYYDEFTKVMADNESIVACDYLTGDYDFMLKIQTQSSETLEHLHRIIKSIRGVSATKTYFVLKEIKCGQTAVGEV